MVRQASAALLVDMALEALDQGLSVRVYGGPADVRGRCNLKISIVPTAATGGSQLQTCLLRGAKSSLHLFHIVAHCHDHTSGRTIITLNCLARVSESACPANAAADTGASPADDGGNESGNEYYGVVFSDNSTQTDSKQQANEYYGGAGSGNSAAKSFAMAKLDELLSKPSPYNTSGMLANDVKHAGINVTGSSSVSAAAQTTDLWIQVAAPTLTVDASCQASGAVQTPFDGYETVGDQAATSYRDTPLDDLKDLKAVLKFQLGSVFNSWQQMACVSKLADLERTARFEVQRLNALVWCAADRIAKDVRNDSQRMHLKELYDKWKIAVMPLHGDSGISISDVRRLFAKLVSHSPYRVQELTGLRDAVVWEMT